MSELRKAAEAVLEAWGWDWSEPRNEALKERMEALRQALAQPEQEPVAWVDITDEGKWSVRFAVPVLSLPDGTKFYTAPPSLEAAVSAEREACAKVCDKEQEFIASGGPYVFSAMRCATNIRARGDK